MLLRRVQVPYDKKQEALRQVHRYNNVPECRKGDSHSCVFVMSANLQVLVDEGQGTREITLLFGCVRVVACMGELSIVDC
jgi:hypothetical protein